MQRLTKTGCLAATLALMAGMAAAQNQLSEVPKSDLTVVSEQGAKLHSFSVYLAADDAQRARGLMFVRSLPLDEGMLFLYAEPREISMWMKNTHIPLDILFLQSDGTVHHIARNTKPFSLERINSQGPVRAVLELNAGVTKNLGISKGDRVLHPFFRQ